MELGKLKFTMQYEKGSTISEENWVYMTPLLLASLPSICSSKPAIRINKLAAIVIGC